MLLHKALVMLSTITLGHTSGSLLNNTGQLLYALDLSMPTSFDSFLCFKINQYSLVLLRAYSSQGNGQFDQNVIQNIWNANRADIGVKVYMTPNGRSNKTGAQQFQELYNNLTNSFVVQTVWLQITSPVNWLPSTDDNVDLIYDIIQTAQGYGVIVGIYTNSYDWQQITDNWAGASSSALWYWNVFGSGSEGETSSDFYDFHPFSLWSSPSAKQFGQQESVCGSIVNRDVFVASSTSPSFGEVPSLKRTNEKIAIGGYVSNE